MSADFAMFPRPRQTEFFQSLLLRESSLRFTSVGSGSIKIIFEKTVAPAPVFFPSYHYKPASPAAFNLHPQPFYFVTTVCTVLLEIPNSFAVCLTVALCSMMYSPKITGRSQSLGIALNMLTPKCFLVMYMGANVRL